MAIKLPELPFNYDDLEPFISQETVMRHYDKHHRGYNEKLNDSIKGTKFSEMSLDDIIGNADGDVFQAAAQVWNHNFYWRCLTPLSGKRPDQDLLLAIEKYYGTFQNFQADFERDAANNFGSGWTWLVKTAGGELKIVNTQNANTPIVDANTTALLTVDVWEHAYYFDYKNRRSDYLKNFWDFVNWHFVQKNFRSG